MQFSWVRLAAAIRKWQKDYGMDLDLVQQMMREFTTHPQWTHGSMRSPDLVFISQRERLVGLVQAHQRRDPGNRHTRGAKSWWR